MKKYFFIMLISIFTFKLFGFGAFNLMNGQNHPELKWSEIESEHIRIVYNEPLLDIAKESIQIAEASYDALTKLYKTQPKDKIILYLSDQDEIVNGAAVMNQYIFIYVNQNDYMKIFSGKEKFLRKVISHEMSHYFLFTAVSGWITQLMPMISASAVPTDINEGFAQFFSGEEWGLNRGDRFLRNGVFSKDFSYDQEKLQSGGLLYAKGFSIVRYLHTFYGEEKLSQWLNYKNKMGLFEFKEAFKKVYGKTFEEMLKEWDRYITTYYYGQVYDQSKNSVDNHLTLNAVKNYSQPLANLVSIKAFNENDFIMVGKEDSNQGFYQILYAKANIDSLKKDKLYFDEKIEIQKVYASYYSMSENGKNIVFVRYSRFKNGSYKPTIFFYNLDDKKVKKIGAGNYAQVMNDGSIYFQQHDMKYNYVMKYQNGKTSEVIKLTFDNKIGDLSLNEDAGKLAVALFDAENNFKILTYDIMSQMKLSEKEMDYFPLQMDWLEDGSLAVLKESPRHDVSILRILNDEIIYYNTPAFVINPVKYNIKDDKLETLVISEIGRKKFEFGKIELEKTNKQAVFESNYYTKWIETKPSVEIDWKNKNVKTSSPKKYNSFKNIKFRSGMILPMKNEIMGTMIFSEPLGKHLLSMTGYIPYKTSSDEMYYNFLYINNMFSPSISFYASRYKMYSAIIDDKFYYHTIKDMNILVDFKNLMKKPYFYFNNQINFGYSEFAPENKDFEYFEKGKSATAGFMSVLGYNLPYVNYQIHPIKKFEVKYAVSLSDKEILSDKSFVKHHINSDVAIAPFYKTNKIKLLKLISFRNLSLYEKINGDTFIQNTPGVSKEDYINFNGSGVSGRSFMRGYEQKSLQNGILFGEEIISSKNEVWLKLTDNLGFNIGFREPFIHISYLGVGGWADYILIKNANAIDGYFDSKTTFKAHGYEIKSSVSVLGFEVIGKYGYAYDKRHNKIGDYFEISLPMDFPL